MRIVILDSFAADQGDLDSHWAGLRALGSWSSTRTAPRLTSRHADGAGAVHQQGQIGAEALGRSKLRYLGVLATGTNVVDLSPRAAGVTVTNVPGYAA
jgi:glycerate dehydrogenase